MADIIRFAKQWLLPPGLAAKVSAERESLRQWFGHSAEEKQLLQQSALVKDRHVGQRCFLLGAGPSISAQDLKLLQGEYVISVSNSFVHPDYPLFAPRYHVTPNILHGHGHVYKEEAFVNWLRAMDAGTGSAELFFHIGDRRLIEENSLFRNRTIHWVEFCHWDGRTKPALDLSRVPYVFSVSEMAITIALCLGFDKIYLLGFDHDWFNGPLKFFYDHNTEHAVKPDEATLIKVGVDSEFQMRRHADIFRKYKYLQSLKQNIFNANANQKSYVDVFPMVDYATLFNAENRAPGATGDAVR